MPTPKGEHTRTRVLEAAKELVIKQGFGSTSVNDIILATGVKKGNLYFHFASKEEIGLAILEEARQEFFQFLTSSLQGPTPLDRLRNFFQAVLQQQQEAKFVGGCLFGNLALEMGDGNPLFAELIRDVFQRWAEVLTDLLAEAQAQGQLGTAFSPELLAKQIVALTEGGIMLAKLSKHGSDLEDCFTSLQTILNI